MSVCRCICKVYILYLHLLKSVLVVRQKIGAIKLKMRWLEILSSSIKSVWHVVDLLDFVVSA